jgi:NAD(P)-dependent dehydrogenase (short-subunit alcohol dehydrogenase family)
MDRLKGKVALVTGAAQGMGFAIARRFLAEGATVIATDVRSQPEVSGWERLDVTSESGWTRIVAETIAAHGRIDVLVNNAGIGSAALLCDTTLFLASDDAAFITGTEMVVDGGYLAR